MVYIPDSEGTCTCVTAHGLAQLCPLSESKHLKANISSQMFPGSLHWLYTVPLGQAVPLLFLLGLFSRSTAALCPISKEIPLQESPCPRCFQGTLCEYKITVSWLAPVAVPKPPKGAAEWMERFSFKMPRFPVTHHLWVTDMVITAHQVSACLRRGLSHTSTHEWDLQTKTILMWLRLKSSDCLQPDSPLFIRFSNYTQ